MLLRVGIHYQRIQCDIPNVCAVDLTQDQKKPQRLIGVYAPESKSWKWEELSEFVTEDCSLCGDFNVDLKQDGEKAEGLLTWADSIALAPYAPEAHTSLRSNRTIDYAFSTGNPLSIQTYEGGTTSDHKPSIAIIDTHYKENTLARHIHWRVFSLFCEFVYPFWESNWLLNQLDAVYDDYSSFLSLLISRCTVLFPMAKYRMAIPKDLRSYMAHTRALSFQLKRKKDVELENIVKWRRKIAEVELRAFKSADLDRAIRNRNCASPLGTSFWSKTKKFMKASTASLHGFLRDDGSISKEPKEIAESAADYFEKLFEEPAVVRPHPYTDAPEVMWENVEEKIPFCTLEEVKELVRHCKKKKSHDGHGLSSSMFNALPEQYWLLLSQIFNQSLCEGRSPTRWKDTRIILLPKKESICTPSTTRPISLLDVFSKVNEKLFLKRFTGVLNRRGILPDSQSGFRPGCRLQTRLLLFLDNLFSLMANSSPITTVFVDFRAAFDQLWHSGCIGKLRRMGVPNSYVHWIQSWLRGRRAFIDFGGVRSRWFDIRRGCPQGSTISQSLFISYNADMCDALALSVNHFFADDLAAILAGSIGMKFSSQCLDLERKLNVFTERLEAYALVALQPINYSKTQALWTARAIGKPNVKIQCNSNNIEWTSSFKYLGYWISPKLGFGLMISKTMNIIRQRIGLINSFRFEGSSSILLRRTLFECYVKPHFTWLMAVFPLFTANQQRTLNHFYYSCLKRVMRCPQWNNNFFSFVTNERSLEDHCMRYWNKFLVELADNRDGELLFGQANLNIHREAWRRNEMSIKGLFRSKRFVQHSSVLEKILSWCA